MKKFIYLLLMFAGMAISSDLNAQTTTMKGSGDSAVNSGTKTCSTQLVGTSTSVTVQVTRVKATGTTSGKVYVDASIDGINYAPIDSVTMTNNVLTFGNTNTKVFVISSPKNYSHIRTRTVTSGTMKIYITDKILQRKD